MIDNEVLLSLLKDIITVLLSIIGILITVGTVIYSFMLSKRESLKAHAEEKKRGAQDFFIDRSIHAEKNYIERMQPLFRVCIYLLISAGFLLVLDYLAFYCCGKQWFQMIVLCLSVFLVLFSLLYLIRQFIVFSKDIRLERRV
jgi:hypothetical protein